MKILNKKEIKQLLKDGNLLSFNNVSAQSRVLDKKYVSLGIVRFDTFLKIRKELNLKEVSFGLYSLEI